MKKDVLITVRSFNDIDKGEVIEVVTPGTFEKIEDGFLATYEETELSGMEGTTTMIKVFPSRFELLREGTTVTKMEFEEGETAISIYKTPFGLMDLSVHTNTLNIEIGKKGIELVANYEMTLSGQPPIITQIEIKIEVTH